MKVAARKVSPKILIHGDAWFVGYVVQDEARHGIYTIRYSGGGVPLLQQLLIDGGKPIGPVHTNCRPKKVWALANVHRVHRFEDKHTKDTFLRLGDSETIPSTQTIIENTKDRDRLEKPTPKSEQKDFYRVVVDRIADLKGSHPPPAKASKCGVYLRVINMMGTMTSDCQLADSRPALGIVGKKTLAVSGAMGAIVPSEFIASLTHIRLQSSYEIIVANLINWLGKEEGDRDNFMRLFGPRDRFHFPKKNPSSFVVIFLPGSAALLYWRDGFVKGQDRVRIIHDAANAAFVRNIGGGEVRWRSALATAMLCEWLVSNPKPKFGELAEAVKQMVEGVISYSKIGMSYLSYNKDAGLSFREWRQDVKGAKSESLDYDPDMDAVVSRDRLWTMAAARVGPRTATGLGVKAAMKERAIDILSKNLPSEDPNSPMRLPLVRFNKITLIDREEIEDYLTIQSVLLTYIATRPVKPVNIAVFGSPGSGKSFGTKELLKHIGNGSGTFQEKPNEFNMAQFRRIENLAEALHEVRNEGLGPAIPVAFFDEFDCTFQDRPYGWLQYLLAPMQDGTFWDNGKVYTLGKCVLVFAGGVNRRFEEMSGRMRDPGFCAAKGPDFISRLRGVLNIRGVNRPESDDRDEGRYYLRRAVILRGVLEQMHRDAGAKPPCKLLEPALARGIISVEGFKHGTRSMESIFRMCRFRPGHTLRPSDLPMRDQLEMHVDGKQFLDEVRTN